MKCKISILIILLLSFINIGSAAYRSNTNFTYIEKKISSQSEFVENAIKVRYITNNKVNDESKKIKHIFKDYVCVNEKKENRDVIYFSKKYITIEISMWYESENLHVEIILNNTNKNYTTNELMKIINEIKDKMIKDAHVYYYYKGKINKPIINNFLKNEKFNNIEGLKINNGYTGIANYKDEKINFAEVKYDTGLYIIIASPIIFTTY